MQDTKTATPPNQLRDEPPSQHRNQELPQPDVEASSIEARQGRLGWPVLAVLIGGLTLALIVGIIIGTVMF
ncbi:MAG: hypothetical protein EA385_15600 [Salinarimonadaceae bacterium]|nr:MAG: hypothetical protein EA385_15600 [Salinarimonadaceae bacterium]